MTMWPVYLIHPNESKPFLVSTFYYFVDAQDYVREVYKDNKTVYLGSKITIEVKQ